MLPLLRLSNHVQNELMDQDARFVSKPGTLSNARLVVLSGRQMHKSLREEAAAVLNQFV